MGRPITTWSSQLPREGHPENRPGWHLVERVIGVMRTWPSARGARNPAVPSATPHRLHAKFSRPRLGSRLLVKPRRFLSTTDVGRELPKLRAELTLESAWDIGGRWAAGGFSRPFCETRVVAALQTASLSNVAVVRIGVLFIEMHLPIRCWSAFGSLRPSSSWGSDVEREAFPKDGRHVKPRPGAGGLQPRCPRAGEDVSPRVGGRGHGDRQDAPHGHALGAQMVSICCTLGSGWDPQSRGHLCPLSTPASPTVAWRVRGGECADGGLDPSGKRLPALHRPGLEPSSLYSQPGGGPPNLRSGLLSLFLGPVMGRGHFRETEEQDLAPSSRCVS